MLNKKTSTQNVHSENWEMVVNQLMAGPVQHVMLDHHDTSPAFLIQG